MQNAVERRVVEESQVGVDDEGPASNHDQEKEWQKEASRSFCFHNDHDGGEK